MPRITRRQLGLAAAAAPAAMAQTPSPRKKYEGALEGLETKVTIQEFDPVAITLERYRSSPLKLTFKAKTRKEAEAWQKQLRSKLTELIGGFPERTALKPQVLETRDFPAYKREKFLFESRPGRGRACIFIDAEEGYRNPAARCDLLTGSRTRRGRHRWRR